MAQMEGDPPMPQGDSTRLDKLQRIDAALMQFVAAWCRRFARPPWAAEARTGSSPCLGSGRSRSGGRSGVRARPSSGQLRPESAEARAASSAKIRPRMWRNSSGRVAGKGPNIPLGRNFNPKHISHPAASAAEANVASILRALVRATPQRALNV